MHMCINVCVPADVCLCVCERECEKWCVCERENVCVCVYLVAAYHIYTYMYKCTYMYISRTASSTSLLWIAPRLVQTLSLG